MFRKQASAIEVVSDGGGSDSPCSGVKNISNSLRIENSKLVSTVPSGGSRTTWTYSGWLKRGNLNVDSITSSTSQAFFACSSNNSNIFQISFSFENQTTGNNKDAIFTQQTKGGAVINRKQTVPVFKDPSAWYHVVYAYDTTQAVAADRIKLWVNGVQITDWRKKSDQSEDPPLNYSGIVNTPGYYWSLSGLGHQSNLGDGFWIYNGLTSDVHFIDGQALGPEHFGLFCETTNSWEPIEYTGTYGTTGFHLDFSDAGNIGKDVSGNGNDFQTVYGGMDANDVVPDSPTNNFPTWDTLIRLPLYTGTPSDIAKFSEGNTRLTTQIDAYWSWVTHPAPNSGKWYMECCFDALYNNNQCGWGIFSSEKLIKFKHLPYITDESPGSGFAYSLETRGYVSCTSTQVNLSPQFPYPAPGDIIGISLDLDSSPRSAAFYRNGTLEFTISDIDSTGPMKDIVFGFGYRGIQDMRVNFGQDSSFAGAKTRQNNTDSNGIGDFYYAPPAGCLALCTKNLPTPEIVNPTEHFNTSIWSGDTNDATQIPTPFAPDFVWIKNRTLSGNSSSDHMLYDTIRGAQKSLTCNTDTAEITLATGLNSFDADGYKPGSATRTNEAGSNYVGWSWRGSDSTAVTNTEGSITSTVSVNPKAGFSIVNWTSTGGTTTQGHGLSQTPEFVVVKGVDTDSSWCVWFNGFTADEYLLLEGTQAKLVYSGMWGAVPNSTTFSVSGTTSPSGRTMAYCFHSVEGYSKIGSYTGNGSTDGPFIHTGFRPAFVLVKRTDATGNWIIMDGKRSPYNIVDKYLFTDLMDSEDNYDRGDFVSNGFKVRTTSIAMNTDNGKFIYMAFAESPFKYARGR